MGCWNVRTMMPGLSEDLQDVSDSRKTAVINNELKRLDVDIATLQETRLADSGTLKEKDYTFFLARDELRTAQRAWSWLCRKEQLAEQGRTRQQQL